MDPSEKRTEEINWRSSSNRSNFVCSTPEVERHLLHKKSEIKDNSFTKEADDDGIYFSDDDSACIIHTHSQEFNDGSNIEREFDVILRSESSSPNFQASHVKRPEENLFSSPCFSETDPLWTDCDNLKRDFRSRSPDCVSQSCCDTTSSLLLTRQHCSNGETNNSKETVPVNTVPVFVSTYYPQRDISLTTIEQTTDNLRKTSSPVSSRDQLSSPVQLDPFHQSTHRKQFGRGRNISYSNNNNSNSYATCNSSRQSEFIRNVPSPVSWMPPDSSNFDCHNSVPSQPYELTNRSQLSTAALVCPYTKTPEITDHLLSENCATVPQENYLIHSQLTISDRRLENNQCNSLPKLNNLLTHSTQVESPDQFNVQWTNSVVGIPQHCDISFVRSGGGYRHPSPLMPRTPVGMNMLIRHPTPSQLNYKKDCSGESLNDSYDSKSDLDSSPAFSPLSSPEKKLQRYSAPLPLTIRPLSNRFSVLLPRKNLFRDRAPKYDLDEFLAACKDKSIIDTHCHLDFLFSKEYHKGTFAAYISKNEKSFPACFEGCVANFIEPDFFTVKHNWESLLTEGNVWASFGIHPHFSHRYNDFIEDVLKDALKHERAVAVGEIGLDYSHKNNCDKGTQQKVFQKQLALAIEHKKPLIIHCRDAQEDCLRILSEVVPKSTCIHRHCFTGNWTEAQEWLNSFPNLFLGFTNLLTYHNVRELRDVVRQIPIHRLLLETDAPYFVPAQVIGQMRENQQKQRKTSNPGMVIHVAAQIAAIRQIKDFPGFLETIRENTRKMYNI